MILVDTSVLIDYLKGIQNEKAVLFDTVLKQKIPFGIAPYTYQEVLQGARNEDEYETLKDYLSTQTVYYFPKTLSSYEKAARMFFTIRRKGIAVRSTIDVLIALTAVENKLFLLHNNKDFDLFAKVITDLKVYR